MLLNNTKKIIIKNLILMNRKRSVTFICVLLLCLFAELYISVFVELSISSALFFPSIIGVISRQNLPHVIYWKPELELQNPFLTDDRRIFFHETSGKGKLSFLQICCVEAAARNHPTRPIQLFLSADSIDTSVPWLNILSAYNNTEVFLLDNFTYFKGTRFESWYVKKDWEKSPYKTAHMSDYLRINSVDKGGGLYMDLDLLTHRPFDEEKFRNFLVYEAKGFDLVSNTIFHLEKNHSLIKNIIDVMLSEYDPQEYIFHGPEAVTAAMYYLCGLNRGRPETNQCANVKMFPHNLINPIESYFSNLYFMDDGLREEWIMKVMSSRATHHFASIRHEQLRKNLTFEIKSNHLFSNLARRNCPLSVMQVSAFEQ